MLLLCGNSVSHQLYFLFIFPVSTSHKKCAPQRAPSTQADIWHILGCQYTLDKWINRFVTSILLTVKWRPRGVKWLSQGCTASSQQIPGLETSSSSAIRISFPCPSSLPQVTSMCTRRPDAGLGRSPLWGSISSSPAPWQRPISALTPPSD